MDSKINPEKPASLSVRGVGQPKYVSYDNDEPSLTLIFSVVTFIFGFALAFYFGMKLLRHLFSWA